MDEPFSAILFVATTFCEGSKEIAKVFFVAVIIDLIYEITFFQVYVGQSMIVAVAVALVPYVLIRGPINRVMQRWQVAVSLSISRIYAEGITPDDL
jgi:hypothetical protein